MKGAIRMFPRQNIFARLGFSQACKLTPDSEDFFCNLTHHIPIKRPQETFFIFKLRPDGLNFAN